VEQRDRPVAPAHRDLVRGHRHDAPHPLRAHVLREH
jgi:hypothetical protein